MRASPDPGSRSRQEAVLGLLQGLQSLDPLKQLFWSELNYDQVNRSLSRRGWAQATAGALADDPLLLAGQGDFHVVYARLHSDDRLHLVDERAVVNRLLRDHPYALFVFSDAGQRNWHFVNVKLVREAEDEANQDPKVRRLFRRISVGPYERLRTASERIATIDLESVERDLFGLSPLAIQRRHDEAFDVEKVTREFYRRYKTLYEKIADRVEGIGPRGATSASERRKQFAELLLNRLLFLYFVQKKGWLAADRGYLRNLFDQSVAQGRDFGDALYVLFEALDSERRVAGLPGRDLVPFLNGGLFDRDAWLNLLHTPRRDATGREVRSVQAARVPESLYRQLFDDLLDHYNFTVTEDTPLDQEVAVDPEMLGKVFEELINERHGQGAYYTPRHVVAFMCQQALQGYLGDALPGRMEAVRALVEDHELTNLTAREATLLAERIAQIAVCDPACGSGAYLVEMLRELVGIASCLLSSRLLNEPKSLYQHKVEVIERSLYGVDINPTAVEIARLRLWLSLAVEYEADGRLDTIPALPNLRYKIVVGDSLTGPAQPMPQLKLHDKLVHEITALKAEYLTCADHDRRNELEQAIERDAHDLAGFLGAGARDTAVAWPVEFAEVFRAGGFHVVLANPPYVRADDSEEMVEYRDHLRSLGMYETLYEKWDLFIPFIERGYQILRQDGYLVYIVSDAYCHAKYARRSQEWFLKNARVARLDFVSDVPIFEQGVRNVLICYQKRSAPEDTPARILHKEDFGDQTILSSVPQRNATHALYRPDSDQAGPKAPGETIPLYHVCYVTYGLRANSEDNLPSQFVTEDLMQDSADETHRPFVRGHEVERWVPRNLKYLEYGTRRAPRRFSRPTFPELWRVGEKLIAMRSPGSDPRTCYDSDDVLCDASTVAFVPWHLLKGVDNRSIAKTAVYRRWKDEDTPPREELETTSKRFRPKFLLAVLNSSWARQHLWAGRRSNIHLYPDDWKRLPIPTASAAQQIEIVRLVDRVLDLLRSHPGAENAESKLAELEAEIDRKVLALYGASPGDIASTSATAPDEEQP